MKPINDLLHLFLVYFIILNYFFYDILKNKNNETTTRTRKNKGREFTNIKKIHFSVQ